VLVAIAVSNRNFVFRVLKIFVDVFKNAT